VNGKIHPFDKPLQNGDVIEVMTRKNSQPKQAWLDNISTTHARNKLRSQLRKLGLVESMTNAAAIIREKTKRKKDR